MGERRWKCLLPSVCCGRIEAHLASVLGLNYSSTKPGLFEYLSPDYFSTKPGLLQYLALITLILCRDTFSNEDKMLFFFAKKCENFIPIMEK